MRHAPALLLVLAAAGCGEETDDRPASFLYIAEAILRPSCGTAACHNSQNQNQGYVFDEPEAAWISLEGNEPLGALYPCRGVPGCSLDDPELMPAFYRTITGYSDVRMPLDSPLPQADIDLIGRWLQAGAERN